MDEHLIKYNNEKRVIEEYHLFESIKYTCRAHRTLLFNIKVEQNIV